MQGYVTDGTKTIPLSALRPEAWSPVDDLDSGGGLSIRRGMTRVPVLYRAIDIRAKAVSRMPFRLERNGQDVTADADVAPLITTLRSLLYLTEASLCCHNAAYWEIGTNIVGQNTTPFWLAPTSIRPDIDPIAGLRGFQRTGGKGGYLPPRKVAHFWGPSSFVEIGPDPLLAPAAVTLAAAGLLHHLDVFAAGFFQRGAIKMTLLTVEGNPLEGEIRKLDAWWKRMVSGVRSAFGSVVIRANIKPQVIGSGIDEVAAPELIKVGREDIAIGMGVPMSLLFSNALAGGTADAERLNFYDFTVVPEWSVLDAPINGVLERLGLRLIATPEKLEVYQAAELAKAKAMTELVGQPIMTVDEGRERLGLPPLPQAAPEATPTDPAADMPTDAAAVDGEPTDAGGGVLLPGTAGALKAATSASISQRIVAAGGTRSEILGIYQNPKTGTYFVSLGDWASEATVDAVRTVLGADVEMEAESSPGDGYTEVKAALKLWQRKALKRLERGKRAACTFESAALDARTAEMIYHDLLHAADAESVKTAFKRAPGEGLSEADRVLYERLRTVLARSGGDIAGAVATGAALDPILTAVSDGVRAALMTALTTAVHAQLAALAEHVPVHVDFDTSGTGPDIAGQYITRFLQGIDATTRTAVETAITAYRETPGMTREDLVAQLAGAFGERRAELIAITSLTEASNQATLRYQQLLKDAGIEMHRRWQTAHDERVCPVCGPLNGKLETEWNDRFPSGGPAHPRCRCSTTLTPAR